MEVCVVNSTVCSKFAGFSRMGTRPTRTKSGERDGSGQKALAHYTLSNCREQCVRFWVLPVESDDKRGLSLTIIG